MGFDQLHPNPRIGRAVNRGCDIRAAYLHNLLLRLMRPLSSWRRNQASGLAGVSDAIPAAMALGSPSAAIVLATTTVPEAAQNTAHRRSG